MTKRPSVLGSLAVLGAAAPEPPAEKPETKPKRRARPEIVHTSVYIPRPVYQRLREIAFTLDCKIHDLLMEGIDATLQKHGHPTVTELKQDSSAAS